MHLCIILFVYAMGEGQRGAYLITKFPSGMFGLIKGLKADSKEVEGGSDGKLCFTEKEKGNVWKDYIERIMNE